MIGRNRVVIEFVPNSLFFGEYLLIIVDEELEDKGVSACVYQTNICAKIVFLQRVKAVHFYLSLIVYAEPMLKRC